MDTSPKHDFIFRENVGPQRTPAEKSNYLAYANLFFTDTFIDILVVETNPYANQYLEDHPDLAEQSRANDWNDTDRIEIRAFLALVINMGLDKRPQISDYWQTKYRCITSSFYKDVMSRNRFQLLLRFLHTVDNATIPAHGAPGYDPIAKVNPVIVHANRVFKRHYVMHREVSIDESLVGCQHRTESLQYLPNKHHHRFGIKLWMLCSSSSEYTMSFTVYRGKERDNYPNGVGYDVCMNLMRDSRLLNKGHSLIVDNLFTNHRLGMDLLAEQTYLTGTLRRHRKGIPKKLYTVKPGVKQQYCMESADEMALAWREKKSHRKPVLLYTTKEHNDMIPVVSARGRPTEKPKVVDYYNKYMGGVDMSDMMLYTYVDERKSLKMWKKVFINITGRMLLNAYIVYKEDQLEDSKVLSRLEFMREVVQELCEPQEQRLAAIRKGRRHHVDDGGVRKLPEKRERNCVVCSTAGYRRRSRTVCSKCGKGLHKDCVRNHDQCM